MSETARPARPFGQRRVTTSLTRFQRLLLGTDGTVTRLLEAYAGEPVEVVKLLQVFDTARDGDADLLAPDGQVLRRRALLRGQQSRQSLLYAEAVVALDRVEHALLAGLLETDKPIGVLLMENRTETFRELLTVGRERAGEGAAHFGVDPTADLLFRTYRIFAGGLPLLLIIEKFPAEYFRGLPA